MSQRKANPRNAGIQTSCLQGRLRVTASQVSLQPYFGPSRAIHFTAARGQVVGVRVQLYALLWREVTFVLRDGRQYQADMVPSAQARHILATLGDAPATGIVANDMPTLPGISGMAPAQSVGLWQRYRAASRGVQTSIGCAAILGICVVCAGVSSALAGPGSSTGAASASQSSGGAVFATTAPTATPRPVPSDTPIPTSVPTDAPLTQPTCIPDAVNCNPWGYNFTHGNFIFDPAPGFCGYFSCIANFLNGRGYVVECRDGTYSKSGGIQGSCSRHQGELQALLAP